MKLFHLKCRFASVVQPVIEGKWIGNILHIDKHFTDEWFEAALKKTPQAILIEMGYLEQIHGTIFPIYASLVEKEYREISDKGECRESIKHNIFQWVVDVTNRENLMTNLEEEFKREYDFRMERIKEKNETV